jgi:hypothetical protein
MGASDKGVANRDAVTTTDGKGATWANVVDEATAIAIAIAYATAAAGNGRICLKKSMNKPHAPTASEAGQRPVIVAHRDQTR